MFKAYICAAALVLGFAAPAVAGADRVSILLGSDHVGASGFNEVNPGLWFTWEGARVDVSAGAFVNSYGRGSVAAVAALPVARWGGGELSLFGGVAYYPGNGRLMPYHVGDVIPIGGVQVRHENLFVQVMPSDGKPVDAVIAFGVTFDLDGF